MGIVTAEIEQATNVLVGKALWRCLRAADMATFQFGRRRNVPDSRGLLREVGEYALHVQCAWRVTKDDRVIVGSSDLYYPADYHEDDQRSPDFDWDKHLNRRDKLIASLFENGTREFIVEKVWVGLAGSLRLVLRDGFFVEVFPENSLRIEHWRLFAPGTEDQHFVVSGRGIET